jgi:hypothetical protein
VPENFESVVSIDEFVTRKRAGQGRSRDA